MNAPAAMFSQNIDKILKSKHIIEKILQKGTKAARVIAGPIRTRVRRKIGIDVRRSDIRYKA